MLEDKTASVQNSPIRSSPLSRRIHDYETDSPIRGTPPPEGGVRHRRRSSEKSTPRARGSSRSRTRAKEEVEISPTAQIYKNLLILEEALRQQNAQQSKLKAKYTIFLVSMLFVLLLTFYVSFVDGGGGGGGGPSYWRFSCQVVGSIDFLTLVLYYLSGEYNRTITRPRKFLTYTNKGIRRMNIRLVKVRVKRVDRLLDMVKMCLLFPTIVLKTQCQYVLVVFPRFGLVIKLRNWLLEFEAKLQSSSGGGVDGVKVILNPRVFSTGTREQWELYRNEFWNKETIRRRRAIQRKQE
ncbi:DEKNAAC105164 [Brettanomyces naardenensis]|uniref:DEKNAAC105164 n=1 Tax=Brettanomyces naardenensis TaxID=13370 RepID=A0A448YSZ6_BRENA|nr:DEKNAAC105164 [Brettanomyces naardenensis]